MALYPVGAARAAVVEVRIRVAAKGESFMMAVKFRGMERRVQVGGGRVYMYLYAIQTWLE